jgi:uncharacterized protein YcaQ
VTVHQLSRTEARRICVRAQRLDRPRPTDLDEVVRHLTVVQYDQTSHVAPNADLVLWSRLGPSYTPSDLEERLDAGRIIDFRGFLRPVEDLRLYRAEMDRWPGPEPLREWQEDNRDWVRANEACRLDILDRLRQDGPLTSTELPDTCEVSWRSSGWNNNRNVRMMLGLMEQRGEIAAAGRRGREQLWDLASRIHPDDDPVPVDEAHRLRDERRLRALGLTRTSGLDLLDEPLHVTEAGEPAVVEGVKGSWLVDPEQLGRPFTGRAALLSPLDRLVYDRKRLAEIFAFDYQLEMYKPVAKRRWGYFALPILYGDRLVGKLDSTADRKAGVFVVDAIHEDVPFTKAMTAAVEREIRDLARMLELELVLPADVGA